MTVLKVAAVGNWIVTAVGISAFVTITDQLIVQVATTAKQSETTTILMISRST
jgi:hypothetical protein